MLEPRWRKEWLDNTHVRFLGGTDKFDFWHNPSGETVRFVYGQLFGQWFPVSTIPHLSAGAVSDIAKSQEDVDAAIAYLKLFAPDLFREIP